MFESHAVTSIDRTSFNQSAFANNHLLCYWLTIHNSISKISPKFQVISFDFVEVKERLDEHWAKIVQSENISLPIYHYVESLWNMTRCNYQSFASKNCGVIPGISCLALIFNLSNQRTIILQAKKRFQVEIKTGQFPVSRETWVLFQKGSECPCSPLAILSGTEPVSALTSTLLNCCTLYNFFSWTLSVAILRWQSCKS